MDADVRMRGFGRRTDVRTLIRLIETRVRPLASEPIELPQAWGRVLAEDLLAPSSVPSFPRAAMDGYAVRAADCAGADVASPRMLRVVGEALPGRAYVGAVGPGDAVRIMTGSPLPEGADAIVRAESAREQAGAVAIFEAVEPGRHAVRPGEDIEVGSVLLRAGRQLRPQDVGVLAAVGATPVPAVRQPCAAVFVTGDELLPCGSRPSGFRVVDSNSVMLSALLRRDGVRHVRIEMLRDRHDVIRDAVASAVEDLILVSGGTSVGAEDHGPQVVRELGELLAHGVALRPAGPTGFGVVRDRPTFLMPGNPGSCQCAYDLFVSVAARRLGGLAGDTPYTPTEAALTRGIVSVAGRTDYVRVRLHRDEAEPLTASGATSLGAAARADGFVLVPPETESLAAGDRVVVWRYAPAPATLLE